jgi:hypothetical protein
MRAGYLCENNNKIGAVGLECVAERGVIYWEISYRRGIENFNNVGRLLDKIYAVLLITLWGTGQKLETRETSLSRLFRSSHTLDS